MKGRDFVGPLTLWDWAVQAYARPGVQALCLSLQDEHGQCVSYLLWAAWAAASGREVDDVGRAQAAALAREWEGAVLGPLRSARRALRRPVTGVDAAGQDSLRTRLQADELDAERLLLEALEAMTPAGTGEAKDLDRALNAAAKAWGAPPPAAQLEALCRAFSNA
jgi:uncharacterized protein (TIGR02444 family)